MKFNAHVPAKQALAQTHVTLTDKQKTMKEKFELTELMLQYTHAEEDGWMMTKGNTINGSYVDCIFRKQGAVKLVITHKQSVFVSKQHLIEAQKLQNYYSTKYQVADVKIVLAYGRLLMIPHRVPKNVAIFSIIEELETEEDFEIIA